MFQGSYVAIVTPFKDNALDKIGLRKNIQFLIKNSSSGIVACATTGESPNLTDEEYETVIKMCVEIAEGKAPVVAGAGTNSTAKTIKLTHLAQACGADGLLVVTPYYNKPTQEGLYQHFAAVSSDTDLPIIIYNVPSRTGINILPKTVSRLARDRKNIVAIKEASGNLDQVSEITMLAGDDFDILSGDDSLTFPMLALGAKGVISVVANILPRDVALMCKYFLEGKIGEARKLHLKMFPLMKALFVETNPIPIKKAMALMGMPSGAPRLPLVEMSAENATMLEKTLTAYGVKL